MRGVSGKVWIILSEHIRPPEELVLRYGPFLAQLITNRGFEREHEVLFDLKLKHLLPYNLLPNIEEALDRIERAVNGGKRIIIFGDYDVDGITGTAIIYDVLKRAGAKVVPVLPTRKTGYGLSGELMKLFSRYGDLLITVDNGTSSIEEIDSSPMEVVVIDHHNVPEEVPKRAVLVNPRISEEVPKPLREVSSSAICFYVGAVLVRRLGLDMDIREHLDLVALGTVGDVMPMNYLNRILVYKGMKVLEGVLTGKIRKPGVLALLKVAGIKGSVSSKELAYSLAPRINAPGRVGDPKVSLKLLLEEDLEKAMRLAEEVERLNLKRRVLTEAVYRKARRKALSFGGSSFVSLWDSSWHAGVIGIVAGRIAEDLGRPVAVFSKGEERAVGSVRSVEGIDVYEGLRKLSHMFIKWGGHSQAAGLTLESSLLKEFSRLAEEVFKDLPKSPPVLYVDMELSPSEVTGSILRDIKSLEPFGEGNPIPVFVSPELCVERVEERRGKLVVEAGGSKFLCWDRRLFPHIRRGMRRRLAYSVVEGELQIVDVEEEHGSRKDA